MSKNKIKQVIIIRKEFMVNGEKRSVRKGKLVAQGAHASMKIFFDRIIDWTSNVNSIDDNIVISITPDMADWIKGSFVKICCQVNSEQELLDIYELANKNNLPCSLIQDSGLTEFGGVPTYTAVAIGPASSEEIDKITGHLSLL